MPARCSDPVAPRFRATICQKSGDSSVVSAHNLGWNLSKKGAACGRSDDSGVSIDRPSSAWLPWWRWPSEGPRRPATLWRRAPPRLRAGALVVAAGATPDRCLCVSMNAQISGVAGRTPDVLVVLDRRRAMFLPDEGGVHKLGMVHLSLDLVTFLRQEDDVPDV
jgi:hypothetical protein